MRTTIAVAGYDWAQGHFKMLPSPPQLGLTGLEASLRTQALVK